MIACIRDEPAVPDPSAAPAEDARKLLVSLATYNEAGNLRPLVETIRQFAPDSSILVIDDNSPDGTGQIADEIRDNLPNVHVLHRPGKLGLGTATLAAVRFAIDHHFDYLLNLDADFSHPPRFIPDLLKGMADHDVMIGSRYVPGGGVEGGFNLKRRADELGNQRLCPVDARPDQQRQQRRVPVLPREQTGRDRPRSGPVAEATRSRKRSSTGASRSAAGSAKRRSCLKTAAPAVSKINMREAVSALWDPLAARRGADDRADSHRKRETSE